MVPFAPWWADFEFLFQLLVAITAITYVYYCWRTRVPIVPTQAPARAEIVAAVKAEVAARPGARLKIYDLGSGTGSLCMAVARAVPEADVVGMELAWPAWGWSILKQRWARQKNLAFMRGDFWRQDISDGDIILCYLGTIIMPQLSGKLLHEPRVNRLIISNTFPLPKEWQPFQRRSVPAMLSKEVLLYRQNTV
ncbi:MAG: hypothetical protein KBA75_03935 [Alphaproteobacteria bacterium]|nr:hypothetical protein [Alphaproteobacteria bacterium]